MSDLTKTIIGAFIIGATIGTLMIITMIIVYGVD